jgi:acetyltransferase-like isoleucine patch superfamily enzyme
LPQNLKRAEFMLVVLQKLAGLYVRLRTHTEVGVGSSVNWINLLRANRGKLTVGTGSIIQCRICFDSPHGAVAIGSRSFVGSSLIVCHSLVTVGHDVLISWGVTIVDHDSHSIYWSKRCRDLEQWSQGSKQWDNVAIRPVYIEDKAWIGFGAVILKGVRVGEGAVVGAGSVVTRDVRPYTLVAGNPAREIREIRDAG